MKFGKILKKIFVENISIKLLALAFAVVAVILINAI